MSKYKLVAHFGTHAAGAISGAAIQAAATILHAWLYGPIAFGELAFFVAASQTLALLTSLSLGSYSISIPVLQDRLEFAATLITGTTYFCAIFAFCFFVLTPFGLLPAFPAGFWIMPAYIMAQAFCAITYGLHLAAGRTASAAASLLMRPVLLLTLGLLFWLFGAREIGLIVAATLSEALVAVFLIHNSASVERNAIFRISFLSWRENWRRRWRFYLTAGLGAYLSGVAGNMPLLFGGWIMTASELGNLAVIKRIMYAPISIVGAPLGAILNRTLADRYHSQRSVVRHVVTAYLLGLLAGAVGFGSITVVLAVFGNTLPDAWSRIVVYAPFVFATGAFYFATSLISFLPLLIGHVQFLVFWSGLRIFGLFLVALLVSTYSLGPVNFLLAVLSVEAGASLLFMAGNVKNLLANNK